jgi:hypothetical protein
MQTDFQQRDLDFAEALAEVLLQQFDDPGQGGFFFTSHDHEQLIHRPKPMHDNATPSGNGMAAFALQRLGHITGEVRYLDAAARTLRLFYPTLDQYPGGCASLLMALEEALEPPRVVVLRGGQAQMLEWRRALDRMFLPATLVLALSPGESKLPPPLDKPFTPGAVNAWVCQGVSCLAPVDNLDQLLGVLK